MTPEPSVTPPTPTISPVVISIAVAAAGVLLFLSVGLMSQALLPRGVGLWFTEAFIFLAVPFVVLQLAGKRPFVAAGVTPINPKGAVFGFVVGLVNYFAAAIPLNHLAMTAASWMWGKSFVEEYDSSGIFDGLTAPEMVLFLTAVTVAAPFCEEFFFRGVFQRGVMWLTPRLTTVVFTGLLFAGFHLDPIGLLPRWELGILFGLLAWKSGSIWPGVFAHCANNLISTVLYLSTQDIPDEALPDWLPIVMVGVGYWLLWGLLKLAQANPHWLEHSRPETREDTYPVPLWRAAAPWLAAAAVVVGICAGVDRRGIELNAYDVSQPMGAPRKSAPESEQQAWKRLMDLREKARSGEGALQDYFDARKLAASEWRTAREKNGTP
ncbi:MAG: CPBP family intramembrane metalloprotease [Myxococcaceae bacterium]|nr:CPBP family intramembrane metalloprotease [Myxococcaceae bacterium]